MDDSWGSPWTSTPTPGRARRTPSPTKSNLEPPTRAFLSAAGSPGMPAVSVASPWDDDNYAFGDWTSANNASTTTPAVPTESGWTGGWGAAETDTPGATLNKQSLSPMGKQEGDFGFAHSSPIAWPSSIALSPGYTHANGTAFPQSSPDPWASSFDELKEEEESKSNATLSYQRPSTSNLTKGSRIGNSQQEFASIWTEDGHGTVVDDEIHAAADGSENKGVPTENIVNTDYTQATRQPSQVDESRTSTSPWPRGSHSRSSSVSRDDTDSDHDRQDSPITSIDEDARSRVALPPRKVSGKIQVLVEKFDGLAKAASEDHLPLRRESTPRQEDNLVVDIGAEHIADFGDVEDVQAPPLSSVRKSSASSTQTSREWTPTTPTVQCSETSARRELPSGTSIATTDVKSPIVNIAPVRFDIDLKQIDSLFDDMQMVLPATTEQAELLPEHVISDSFTEMSERRTWYRISRQGSSRLHDSGDGDNYRRVVWPTTTVHDETLKIVRRWMEQDSITGRTMLGGGSSRANMFNWDLAAEPVALEQIFAQRRRQQRPTSLQQPLNTAAIKPAAPVSLARDAQEVSIATKQRPMSLAGVPVGSFGWSTSPVTHGPAEPQLLKHVTKPELDIVQTQTLSSQLVVGQAPVSLEPPVTQADDDEDWGEMVSSPPVDAKPMTFPSSDGALEALSNTSPVSTIPIVSSSQSSGLSSSIHPIPNEKPISVPDSWELPPPPPTRFTHSSIDTAMAQQLCSTGGTMKPAVMSATVMVDPALTPMTPLEIVSPLPVSTERGAEGTTGRWQPGGRQGDDDALVQQIIEGLPDLSYMLK